MLVSLTASLSVPVAGALGLLLGAALAWSVAAWRHRAERARTRSASRAPELLELAPDLVLVHAPDGTGLEPNAAARAALGLGTQAADLSLLDAVALDDQPAAREHLARLAAGGSARTDLRLRGTDRLFDLASQLVNGVALTVGRDVGERAAREDQAWDARDRARADARDKSAFLDSMSHDLRTPLTAVLGFAELLRDEVEPESRGLVQAIETGGQRLLRTLDGVLDLARLDAGRTVLHPAPIDVVAAVEHVAARHRPAADAAGLALRVEASSASVPATLDPRAVERVVGTLVGNAVAFTEQGGITVEVVEDADAVTLRVLDTGPGIAADVLPTLFSEHRRRLTTDDYQEGVTSPAPVGETTLGLAVARRLVELAGGTISVESRWGQGTAFTVVLPRGPIPEWSAAPAGPELAGVAVGV